MGKVLIWFRKWLYKNTPATKTAASTLRIVLPVPWSRQASGVLGKVKRKKAGTTGVVIKHAKRFIVVPSFVDWADSSGLLDV